MYTAPRTPFLGVPEDAFSSFDACLQFRTRASAPSLCEHHHYLKPYGCRHFQSQVTSLRSQAFQRSHHNAFGSVFFARNRWYR